MGVFVSMPIISAPTSVRLIAPCQSHALALADESMLKKVGSWKGVNAPVFGLEIEPESEPVVTLPTVGEPLAVTVVVLAA